MAPSKIMKNGFTLIEIIVTIAIIAVLSGIILFSITQYIKKGKDSNIQGNLAVLVPAGEAWYNGRGNSYEYFCDSSAVDSVKNQLDQTQVLCYVKEPLYQEWAACADKFSDSSKAYCVDSRNMKKEIDKSYCVAPFTLSKCP